MVRDKTIANQEREMRKDITVGYKDESTISISALRADFSEGTFSLVSILTVP